jgi:hypothetical protein
MQKLRTIRRALEITVTILAVAIVVIEKVEKLAGKS